MSPTEVRWRMRARARDAVDFCVLPIRRRDPALARIAEGNGQATAFNTHIFGDRLPVVGDLSSLPTAADGWRTALMARADRLLENRHTFFDLQDEHLGDPIDWNRDVSLKVKAPCRFSPWLDYRDSSVAGDAKLVWEPNRHHHLVVLGRAYRLTGDERYAGKVVEDIEGWIRQCPFGLGMNWRSPMELAIRLINWVVALELVSPSACLTRAFRARLVAVVYRHLWEISRKYSRCSSANNHLVGEAAGVFVGSCYFTSLGRADSWRRGSREILLREIESQVLPDGGHCELAPGYHTFVLQFFLLAGVVARDIGDDFPQSYWDRLESMFDFQAALHEGGGRVPMFGDCDDGYVVDLGGGAPSSEELLCVGAVLFERGDLKRLCGGFREPAYWLFGAEGVDTFAGLQGSENDSPLRSRALPDSGLYLLQHGSEDRRISVTMDCGDLGFGVLAAHGHADAMSVTLRAGGEDILVDPGTFDYFTYPKWRNHFRSTASHNTLAVDGKDQSQMCGPFLWGRRAEARCLDWNPASTGGEVAGEHDGYARLDDPVIHRRAVSLDGDRQELLIRDELVASGDHEVAMYLHFGEECTVTRVDDHLLRIDCGLVSVSVSIDSRLTVELIRGDDMQGGDESLLGWVSRGYHRKRPSTTLRAGGHWSGELKMETRLQLSWCDSEQSLRDGRKQAVVGDGQRQDAGCCGGEQSC